MSENKGPDRLIIGALLILLISSIGYIFYEKEEFEKEITKLNTQITKLQNTENQEYQNKLAIGYYKAGNFPEPSPQCDQNNIIQTKEIKIIDNKNFISYYKSNCEGPLKHEGTYIIKNNKLMLKCDSKKSQQCDEKEKEYIINEDGTITEKKHSGDLLYKKTAEKDLQLFNK